jgi:hypothetical protein
LKKKNNGDPRACLYSYILGMKIQNSFIGMPMIGRIQTLFGELIREMVPGLQIKSMAFEGVKHFPSLFKEGLWATITKVIRLSSLVFSMRGIIEPW